MEKIEKIYNEMRFDVFAMAVSHLMDIGFRNAQKITDEDIEEIEMDENSFMTTEFCKELVRAARDLANASGAPSKLMKFCAEHEIFGDPKRIVITEDESGMIQNVFVTPNMSKAEVEIIDRYVTDDDEREYADEQWKFVEEEYNAGELVSVY